jgi:hypothetical protein
MPDDLVDLSPPICDGAFAVTWHDLGFLELSLYSTTQWWMRMAPLGLHGALQPFLDDLRDALDEDEVVDADLRVKGSSAEFFSSVLKPMPTSRAEWADLFERSYLGPPAPEELDAIGERWIVWLSGRNPPSRRPFDSLGQLGIQRDLSDIDLQLSSNGATAQAAAARPADPEASLFHPQYDFVRDEFAQLVLPRTFQFAADAEARLDRPVNVKLFDGPGPPDKSHDSPVSAHFKETDWVLI